MTGVGARGPVVVTIGRITTDGRNGRWEGSGGDWGGRARRRSASSRRGSGHHWEGWGWGAAERYPISRGDGTRYAAFSLRQAHIKQQICLSVLLVIWFKIAALNSCSVGDLSRELFGLLNPIFNLGFKRQSANQILLLINLN